MAANLRPRLKLQDGSLLSALQARGEGLASTSISRGSEPILPAGERLARAQVLASGRGGVWGGGGLKT